jgi:SAM-dependent methyltransferase
VRPTRLKPAGDFDYEAGGEGYTRLRQPDPRIASLIQSELGGAQSVINVGAGAGSYEPLDRYVLAVEPSAAMRSHRPPHLPPAIDATAEALPVDDNSFDAAMATLTVHHWNDLARGLSELRRVSRGRVVILTFDPLALDDFWLVRYFPEVIAVEQRRFPTLDELAALLGDPVSVKEVPIAIDCPDGFGEAYYARPEAFLDAGVRRAQSGFGLTDPAAVARGIQRLREDLATGAWDGLFGHVRTEPERIGAVRLVVAGLSASARSA